MLDLICQRFAIRCDLDYHWLLPVIRIVELCRHDSFLLKHLTALLEVHPNGTFIYLPYRAFQLNPIDILIVQSLIFQQTHQLIVLSYLELFPTVTIAALAFEAISELCSALFPEEKWILLKTTKGCNLITSV